jgi:hypothetical protein
MRSRFFGAASMDDDEDDEDYDMSGFVGDQVPPKPPIMERPRVNEIPPTEEAEHIGASSYAGPTNRVRTNPAASINYAPSFVTDVKPDDAGRFRGFNPLWASDNSRVPKLSVVLKTAGLSVALLTAYPALRRQVTGKTGMAFIAGNYAYLSQSLGYNHGVLESNLVERHFLIQHSAKIVAHGLLGFTAFKLFRR